MGKELVGKDPCQKLCSVVGDVICPVGGWERLHAGE